MASPVALGELIGVGVVQERVDDPVEVGAADPAEEVLGGRGPDRAGVDLGHRVEVVGEAFAAGREQAGQGVGELLVAVFLALGLEGEEGLGGHVVAAGGGLQSLRLGKAVGDLRLGVG